MAEHKQKLDQFTAAVLSEAVSETDALTREMAQRRKEVLSAAEARAREEADEYLRGELSRVKAEQGRQVSRRMLENKRALALRREEIARAVFEKVARKVEAYTAGPDYPGQLLALFRQAVEAVGPGDLVLYLRPQDLPHGAALCRAAGGRRIEVRQGDFRLGGLILDCPGSNLRADQTYDCKLKDLDGHFAELFGLALPADGGPEGA